jgi:hypothetical protein
MSHVSHSVYRRRLAGAGHLSKQLVIPAKDRTEGRMVSAAGREAVRHDEVQLIEGESSA